MEGGIRERKIICCHSHVTCLKKRPWHCTICGEQTWVNGILSKLTFPPDGWGSPRGTRMPENATNRSKQLVNVCRFILVSLCVISEIFFATFFSRRSWTVLTRNTTQVTAHTNIMHGYWLVPVEVKVKSLDWARSVPFTVPRSNLRGNRAAHQECLTANPGAFLARRASEYHTKLSYTHTHTLTHESRVYWKCSLAAARRVWDYLKYLGRQAHCYANNKCPEPWALADFKTSVPNCKPVVSHTTSFQFPKFLAHSVEVSSSVCVLTLRCESYAISNSFLCRWHRLTSLWLH